MTLRELLKVIPAGQIIRITKQSEDKFYEDRQLLFSNNYLNEKNVKQVISGIDNKEDVIIIEVE